MSRSPHRETCSSPRPSRACSQNVRLADALQVLGQSCEVAGIHRGYMPHVYLRPWRVEDVRDIRMMVADEHVRRWSSMSLDLEAWVRREVAQPDGLTRAVCWPGDDRVVGRVAVRTREFASAAVRCGAIRDDDQPSGELSYWLVPDARGLGIAGSAVRSMIATVVPHLGLRSVVLDIEPGNTASVRVAQRLGAGDDPQAASSATGPERRGSSLSSCSAASLDEPGNGPTTRL